jgi:putative endonuclease
MAGLVPAIPLRRALCPLRRDHRDSALRAGPVMTEIQAGCFAGGRACQACRANANPQQSRMRQFYVYILASRPGGALYVGVTNDLIRRVYEHKNGLVEGHTKRYGIDRLVYFETHDTVYQAIQREKNIKHWPRVYKTRLIAQINDTWRDLYDELVGPALRGSPGQARR